MDNQTTATIIATVIASLIASIVAYIVGNKANRSAQLNKFHDHIFEINRLAMQYPYLEDNDFCESWKDNRHSKEEKYQRYDNYCCIVFNLIEQIWKFYNGDKTKIKDILVVEELINRHKSWWKAPSSPGENIYGYNFDFSMYLESHIGQS